MALEPHIERLIGNASELTERGWDFSPRRFTLPYKACLLAGTALVPVAIVAGLATGMLSLPALALAAVGGTCWWFGRNYYLDNEDKNIHERAQPPLSEEREMATALMKRAGLAHQPLSMWSVGGDYADNAAMCHGDGTAELLIGRKIGYKPDTEQCAVIAHEIGHLKGHPGVVLEALVEPLIKCAGWGLVLAAMIPAMATNGSPKMLMLALLVKAGQFVVSNVGKRFEEDRADRNSAALFPHPTALGDYLSDVASDNPFDRALMNAFEWALSDHTPDLKRLRLIKEFNAEAADFLATPSVHLSHNQPAPQLSV